MRHLTISQKLYGGVGALIALGGILGSLSLWVTWDAEASLARWAIVGIVLLATCVGGLVAYQVYGIDRALRHAVIQMRDGAEQVMSAASQVSVSSQSLSQGATEQAASLEETSASMEQMASMTRMNADNAEQAATLMGEVDAQVATSNRMLGQMVTAMASIRDSSAKVSKIIKTIDEIAFQTNILALNAAVEAARAGEAGMGFAVVADEVRNLAQRAAQAARDTASLIDEARQNAEQGGQTVEQVTAAITQFTASVSKVKGIAEEVNSASRQQAQGIDQVTQAIAQMEKVTQNNAATAEESAAASEELNAQSEVSVRLVRDLEAMVGGAGVTTGASRRRTTARAKAQVAAPSKVLKLPVAKAAKSPEEQIPLEDTGSFGRF